MSADYFNTTICMEFIIMLFGKINIEFAHPCLYL